MTHTFTWLKPSLLWQTDQQDYQRADFFQPQVLEFKTDDFMDEFLETAGSKAPSAFRDAVAVPPATDKPLKLFQPIHGCYYLVCATLSCNTPGFPDRALVAECDETVFFVLRKVKDNKEYGWIVQNGKPKGWQIVEAPSSRVPTNEERFPLFDATSSQGRILRFGYLPTSSRETYEATASELAGTTSKSASQEKTAPLPKFAAQAGERYVVRCVYERPKCDPPQQWISERSKPFEISALFDPDAPTRQVTIQLPVDVSPEGLQKFRKGATFMLSNSLRNKLARIMGKEEHLLDGDASKLGSEGSFNLGHICSLSIPIITICAFILLLIIVNLLNLVFWWIPYFWVCLPLKLSSE